jgi:hypothetical protein
MSRLSVDEGRRNDTLKTAIVEAFEQRKDLVRDLLEEVFEDIALVRASETGANGDCQSR